METKSGAVEYAHRTITRQRAKLSGRKLDLDWRSGHIVPTGNLYGLEMESAIKCNPVKLISNREVAEFPFFVFRANAN